MIIPDDFVYINRQTGMGISRRWSDFWAEYVFHLWEWRSPIVLLGFQLTRGKWRHREYDPYGTRYKKWAEHYEMRGHRAF